MLNRMHQCRVSLAHGVEQRGAWIEVDVCTRVGVHVVVGNAGCRCRPSVDGRRERRHQPLQLAGIHAILALPRRQSGVAHDASERRGARDVPLRVGVRGALSKTNPAPEVRRSLLHHFVEFFDGIRDEKRCSFLVTLPLGAGQIQLLRLQEVARLLVPYPAIGAIQ